MFGLRNDNYEYNRLMIENAKLESKYIQLLYKSAMKDYYINSELKRLKPDHWDKEAFDVLIKKTGG